ncbi:MAG: DUF1292 domain-containing protein [Lachnospiraceae bacterium]|jgi:uncharacterized protein YrzB (UPF0473 family)|nr:DUF1292 domain-containing protein [Lachnospiraceae bacterium]
MNNKNKEFFFGGEEDEVAVITFTDSDGITVQAEVIANVEIEEFQKEYIATLPIEEIGKYKENNLIILEYSEDEEGNPQFTGITDPEELKDVSDIFMEYFSS